MIDIYNVHTHIHIYMCTCIIISHALYMEITMQGVWLKQAYK